MSTGECVNVDFYVILENNNVGEEQLKITLVCAGVNLECIEPELRSGRPMQPKRSLGESRWTPQLELRSPV